MSNASKEDLPSLQRQLASARENLRLIQERKTEFVFSTDISLQLVKEERRWLDEIAKLEQQLAGQPAEGSVDNYEHIMLQPEQEELLSQLVEAARSLPRDNRKKFVRRNAYDNPPITNPALPDLKIPVYSGDIQILANAGLILLTPDRGGAYIFDVTPLGFSYCAWLKRRTDQPIEATEMEIRRHVNKESPPRATSERGNEIFVVHGHETALREAVARLLEKLELKPIILFEQPDRGQTIIEKLEKHSNVTFAVILLTPDDVGYPAGSPDSARPRARQNVILELGYFMGLLGRENVCVLHTGGLELPSDISGVLYTLADSEAWKFKLSRELKAAGFDIDLNKVVE